MAKVVCPGLRVLPSPVEHLKQPHVIAEGFPWLSFPVISLSHRLGGLCVTALLPAGTLLSVGMAQHLLSRTQRLQRGPRIYGCLSHFLPQQRRFSLFYFSLCALPPSLFSVQGTLDRFPTLRKELCPAHPEVTLQGQHSTLQHCLAAPQAAHRGLGPT